MHSSIPYETKQKKIFQNIENKISFLPNPHTKSNVKTFTNINQTEQIGSLIKEWGRAESLIDEINL